jgi:hypothetical protein
MTGNCWLLLPCLDIQGAETVVAVRLERVHTKFLGQDQGLLVVGFGLHDIRGIGVGVDNAKLVQREHLIPSFLELPGLLTTSRQTTDLTELYPVGSQTHAQGETFAGSLLEQRVPPREAPLERIGSAQVRRDPPQP